MNTSNVINNSAINQTDYLKLFMQELTYQDPLKPIDNREFMAQMAQFSVLQEMQTTNQYLSDLSQLNLLTLNILLLNKSVRLENEDSFGEIKSIQLHHGTPELSINSKGTILNKTLADIEQIYT